MKKISLYIVCVSLIMSGCVKTPSISSIERDKKENFKNNFKIEADNSDGKYKVYINKDNEITNLCYLANGYDKYNKRCRHTKESDEDSFYINKNSYFHDAPARGKEVSCGVGMRLFMDEKRGTDDVCNSKFTKLNGIYFVPRLKAGIAIYIVGVTFLGNLHSVTFDEDNFRDAISDSNIDSFKNELFNVTRIDENLNSFDVIYLEAENIKNSLENKYDKLLVNRAYNNGIVFLEKDTKKLISIITFKDYNNYDTIESISLQIKQILSDISINNKIALKYKDFSSKIPEEISLPILPKIPSLVKDEFETKNDFNIRVRKAVEDRETKIRDLQKQYSKDILERNSYIKSLQEVYKKYLTNSAEEKYELLDEAKESIAVLSKVLFLENVVGYDAKDFNYDVEEEKMYFTIFSKNGIFSQPVVAEVPVSSAKIIKKENKYEILPSIEATDNTIKLLGFEIKDTINNDSFEVGYTDINYKSEEMSVRIVNKKENIDKEASKYFQKYKQDDIAIVDTNKKEIWYIDIVNSINARVPKWFSTPIQHKTIGYGEGDSLSEAKANALKDLAFMVKVKVNVVYESSDTVNNFKSFNEIKQQTRQSSNVELSSNNYQLYKQDNIDGKWYVGLMLDKI